jgi:hypothetical protein
MFLLSLPIRPQPLVVDSKSRRYIQQIKLSLITESYLSNFKRVVLRACELQTQCAQDRTLARAPASPSQGRRSSCGRTTWNSKQVLSQRKDNANQHPRRSHHCPSAQWLPYRDIDTLNSKPVQPNSSPTYTKLMPTPPNPFASRAGGTKKPTQKFQPH